MASIAECKHGNSVYDRCSSCNAERATLEKVTTAFEAISNAINGGYGDAKDMLATLVSNEHPTLTGIIVKAIATGVVRRADYNPEWKPWDGFFRPLCAISRGTNYADFSDKAWEHPDHDGRLDCSTVVGAILMARQSYI